MKLLLKGGRVIDPSQGMDTVTDILIEDGKISCIKKRYSPFENGCNGHPASH